MLFPALRSLTQGLHTTANDIAWALTAYFLTAAVATPILGRLGDMFGKRRMLVVSMAAFTAGALISAVSTALWLMVAGRALAGVGGGVFPLSFGMVRELVPRRQVALAVGFLAATIASGGAVGLLIGGVIVDHLTWRWIFWTSVAMGVVATVCLRVLIPESVAKSGGRVDVRGAVVLAIGLILPLVGISRAPVWGWTDLRTLALIAVGLVVLAAWVRLELHTEEPLANIASLRSRQVFLTNLSTFPPGFAANAMFLLVSLLAQTPSSTGYGLGLDATEAGLVLVPAMLVGALAGPVSGAVGGRIGNTYPLVLAGVVGTAALVLLAYEHDSVAEVAIYAALVFGASGLAFAALPNLIIGAVPPRITGESVAFNFLVTRVSASVGLQAVASIVAASAIAGSGQPTDHGFEVAFLVCAAVWLIGTIVAMLIPRRTARSRPA